MIVSCSVVPQQLVSLQGHLRDLHNELANCLKNCTDNCDECNSFKLEIQQTRAQIAVVAQQQGACALMLGPWNINANGFTLTLTIVTEDVFEPDQGRLTFVGWIGNDFTFGNYFYSTGQIDFERDIDVSESQLITQNYTGSLFANPTGSAPATFAGTFTSSDSPNSTFGWFMSRSS